MYNYFRASSFVPSLLGLMSLQTHLSIVWFKPLSVTLLVLVTLLGFPTYSKSKYGHVSSCDECTFQFCLVNRGRCSDRQTLTWLNVPDRRGRRWQLCPAGTQRGSTHWWERDEPWVTQTTNHPHCRRHYHHHHHYHYHRSGNINSVSALCLDSYSKLQLTLVKHLEIQFGHDLRVERMNECMKSNSESIVHR